MRRQVRCAGHTFGQDCWAMVAPGAILCPACQEVWDDRYVRPLLARKAEQEAAKA